jgi:hypothetical protein
MKSRFLRSKKGDMVSNKVVGWLLALALLAVAIVIILLIRKTGTNVHKQFTQCEGISVGGKIGRCLPATAFCGESIAGEGLGCSAGQICCFDTVETASPEESKLYFKNNFKIELEACRDDVSKCDKATERLISIAGAVNEDGQGEIFVIMKKISKTSTTFALAERTKTFTSPKRIDEFTYTGDTCAMIRKKGQEPEQDYYTSFELGAGRNNQGELVVFKVGGSDLKIGTLEGIRHKIATDITSPLCLVYSQ